MRSITGLILCGLFFAAAAVSVPAADVKSPPATKKAAATTLTGRIVFIDKTLHTVAVDVKGKLLQINLVPYLKVNKNGTLVSFEELAPGQEVTVAFRETVDGRLEVVSVNIDGSSTQAEAAKQLGKNTKKDRGNDDDHYKGTANPANTGGLIRSPNH